MFSLRKRAKFISQIDQRIANDLLNSIETKKSFCVASTPSTCSDCFLLTKLPIEILFLILEKLSVKDLLKLRQANTEFKKFIDKSECLWNRIYVKFIVTNNDFNSKFEFLHSIMSKINFIQLDCSQIIKKKLIEHRQTTQSHIEHLGLAKNVTVKIQVLNVLSLSNLNYFNYCTRLVIESFNDTTGPVKNSKHSAYYEMELIPFTNLKFLDINCKIYIANNKNHFEWTNIASENKMISQMRYLFSNITELRIHFYFGSFKKLIRNLKGLIFLKVLEIENSYDKELSIKNSLKSETFFQRTTPNQQKLKTLQFNSLSIESILFVIIHLYDSLDFLQNLTMFVSTKTNDDCTIEDTVLNYFYGAFENLKFLKCLTTNILQFVRLKNNFFAIFSLFNLEEINLVSVPSFARTKTRTVEGNDSHIEYTQNLSREQIQLIIKANRNTNIEKLLIKVYRAKAENLGNLKKLDINLVFDLVSVLLKIKTFKIDLCFRENEKNLFVKLESLVKDFKNCKTKIETFCISVYIL